MVIAWCRGKAKINSLLGNGLPRMHTPHESTCRPPYEIVEMIIAHLTHNLGALKACSLTCRSWYIATAPHFYHTLALGEKEIPAVPGTGENPLTRLDVCRMPLAVREIWVRQPGPLWFNPRAFTPRDLSNFSTFANVHTLRLQRLEIPRFIPGVERYFGHFSSSLRSIALYHPIFRSPLQLPYFLSLFSNLDDVEIRGFTLLNPSPNTELVAFSAPKLQGELILHSFRASCWAEIWTYLVASGGGLRFRYMDLRMGRKYAPVLLGACANTLETLRFYAMEYLFGR